MNAFIRFDIITVLLHSLWFLKIEMNYISMSKEALQQQVSFFNLMTALISAHDI